MMICSQNSNATYHIHSAVSLQYYVLNSFHKDLTYGLGTVHANIGKKT